MTFRFAGKSEIVASAIILIMMSGGLVRADAEREAHRRFGDVIGAG